MMPRVQQRQALRGFHRRMATATSMDERLSVLQHFVGLKFLRLRDDVRIQRTATLRKMKRIYEAHRERIVRQCVCCLQRAHQEHHVIRLALGGTNEQVNRVWLCRRCHKAVHLPAALDQRTRPT